MTRAPLHIPDTFPTTPSDEERSVGFTAVAITLADGRRVRALVRSCGEFVAVRWNLAGARGASFRYVMCARRDDEIVARALGIAYSELADLLHDFPYTVDRASTPGSGPADAGPEPPRGSSGKVGR